MFELYEGGEEFCYFFVLTGEKVSHVSCCTALVVEVLIALKFYQLTDSNRI